MSKSSFPAIFYVYANRTFKEELEAYLIAHFSSLTDLGISNATGIGYKIECYDVGELKALDVELEKYEGWIQQSRRTEFADVDTEFFDLDKFISGCNKRISYDPTNTSVENKQKIKWRVNANGKTVAVRNVNFTSSSGAVAGSYEIVLGNDKIAGGIPIGATIDINRVYRKSLNGEFFDVKSTDAYLTGYVIEFKAEEMRSLVLETTTLNTTNFDHLQDDDYSTRWSPDLDGLGSTGYHDYLTLRNPLGELYKEPALPYTKLNMIMAFVDDMASRFNVRVLITTTLRNNDSFLYTTTVFDEYIETKTADEAQDGYYTIDLTQPFNRMTILFYLPSAEYVHHSHVSLWEMFLS